ncbi:MAG: 23S rRNA (guanosine(2251)-2'-O)-methyltransferase RlmB [Oscillospiraceae bacterium]|nr:23S rRNA (guanosine(2251)-2'-O)-methyltransferase RlmB [Oscillospiraceae bacterium]
MDDNISSTNTNDISVELLEGVHAITEALRAGRPLDKLYVSKDAKNLRGLLQEAKRAQVVVIERERANLDGMSATGKHQGVIASVAARRYADLDEIIANAKQSERPALIVCCDGIDDGRNLGAICRTAEAAGAHGVVVTKRRSASLSVWTDRAAAGALEHLPLARVSNLTTALKTLKDNGLWIYGADADGNVDGLDADFSGACALVLGSEESGLSRLVREQCDFIVSLPMLGKIGSLNVSAAAAVLLYTAVKTRR